MKKLFVLLAGCFITSLALAQPPNVPADKGAVFGEKISTDKALSTDDAVALLNRKEGEKKMDLRIRGEVVQVCEAEGCWLRLKTSTGTIMVRTKGHQFFVPTALHGKEVVVEGTTEIKETSVAQLKHYAEDAGKSKAEIDAIKEPKKEVVVQAKGIVVVK